jgi:hypothetical protein
MTHRSASPGNWFGMVASWSTPSGVTIQTYRPAGRATFGIAG